MDQLGKNDSLRTSATLVYMDLSGILNEINKQIAQLQQAKALLTDFSAPRTSSPWSAVSRVRTVFMAPPWVNAAATDPPCSHYLPKK